MGEPDDLLPPRLAAVSETNPAGKVWHPVDYDSAWVGFSERFDFRPSTSGTAAITPPADSLVVDLGPVFRQQEPGFPAAESAVNASALRSFVRLSEGADLLALDWQHPAYRYSPAAHALAGGDWPVPVFPNGDYHVHATTDLAWGTFGHPWHQTLTIWGEQLVTSLGADLLTWLPHHPSSR